MRLGVACYLRDPRSPTRNGGHFWTCSCRLVWHEFPSDSGRYFIKLLDLESHRIYWPKTTAIPESTNSSLDCDNLPAR